jgi:signal transduction histidine kinase
VLVSVGAALVAVVVGFNLLLAARLSGDADAVLRARASAELSTLRVENGRVRVAEAPDEGALDSQVWVFAANRAVERPKTVPALDRAADALGSGAGRRAERQNPHSRLYAVPVVDAGKRVGTVVVATSLEPYTRTQRIALVASVVLALVLFVVAAALARWLVGAALRPVAQMTEQASEWSERDLDRRFAAGEPHDELTQLAATLDRLLDRITASLRREQRFSAEISHELRTPLARISAEAELALAHERAPTEYRAALESVRANAAQLAGAVETLVTAARAESSPRGTSDAAEGIGRAIDANAGLAEERGIQLSVIGPRRPLRIDTDAAVVERVLVPLIENACHYGRGRVELQASANTTGVEITIEDDGPGVAAGEEERIFEPGQRGTAAGAAKRARGVGLGLALAQRLARAAGGDIAAEPSTAGGRFRVTLPGA